MAEHRITRLRRETRRRKIHVTSVEELGDAMLRVWFTGEDLADFESDAPDDHVKLFFADMEDQRGAIGRDYTPRLFDVAARTLAIDFALHGSLEACGPATRWAMAAKPGDELEIGGPRGSVVVEDNFDWYLLVGDTTALPAIARRMEGLRGDAIVHVILLAAPEATLPSLVGPNMTTILRVEPVELSTAIADWRSPGGDGFVWIAAEANVARAGREAALDRGWPREWLKASGYWRAGDAGVHEKLGS